MITQTLASALLLMLACMSAMASDHVVIDNPTGIDPEYRAKAECWKLITKCGEKVVGRQIRVEWRKRNIDITIEKDKCRVADSKQQLTSRDAAKILKDLRKTWVCGGNLPSAEEKLGKAEELATETSNQAQQVDEKDKLASQPETIIVPAPQATPKPKTPKKRHRVELLLTIQEKGCKCKE